MNASASPSPTPNLERRVALFGALLAFLALFAGWFDPATTPRLSAWQIGIGQEPEIPGAFQLFSFGTVGLILCGLIVFAAWRPHRTGLILASATLLFLGLDCFLQIAVIRPEWIEEAKNGATDFRYTMGFANSYSIPEAYSVAPNDGILLTDGALPDRFAATYSCLNYGWYGFLLGGLLSLGAAFSFVGQEEYLLRPLWLWALLCLVILAGQLTGPLAGEYYLWNGDLAAARDDIGQAEREYRHAIALDGWYRVRPELYLKIGALRQSHGDNLSAEARFFLGEDLISRGSYELGMYWLDLARITDGPDLARQVSCEIAKLSLIQGNRYYKLGSLGAAMDEWRRSIQAQPRQVAPYYMLGMTSMDLASPDQARKWLLRAQSYSTLPVVGSLCWAAIGDTYYKSGELDKARTCYFKSTQAYSELNYRALKSLIDDYFK